MFLLEDLKQRMIDMDISPNKLLGQNFLVSPIVIGKIIEASLQGDYEKYIEVGPGPGALTDRLEEGGVKPLLIEMDRKIATYWEEKRGFEVIQGDALKQDWNKLTEGLKTCFVSNLPYQISSSIVIDRSIGNHELAKMVLMFQKEVAQRIVAPEGGKDYSLLSVIAQSFWKIEKVIEAGPKDFYPPPKVASRVLQFERLETEIDGMQLLKLVKAAFAQRRKRLLKNLGALSSFDLNKAKEILLELNHNENVRAEQLSVGDYHRLLVCFK